MGRSDVTPRGPYRLREIAIPAFGPSLLYGIADGAVLPVLAFTARDLGASLAVAGFVVALMGVGSLVSNLPAAVVASRFGERRAMLGAAAIATVAFVLCIASREVWLLALAALMVGSAGAVFSLARQTWLVAAVPYVQRARALSTLAGCMRIGMFLGPFAGAGLIHWMGLSGAYVVAIVAMVVLVGLVWRLPDLPEVEGASGGGPPAGAAASASIAASTSASTSTSASASAAAPSPPPAAQGAPPGFGDVLRTHAGVFATLGIAVLLVGAIRACRQVAVPLWADAIGLAPVMASLVYGVAALVDMAVFYPAGRVMDLYGRIWVAVPCAALIGLSLLAIPLTTDFASLLVVATVLGLGNGIGSGIVMTLGADAAPVNARPRFLGIWRMLVDTGASAGPLLLASLAGWVSLAVGIQAIGVLGLVAAAVFWRVLPRRRET